MKFTNHRGQSVTGIRCSFEFMNRETQRPLVVAMNAMPWSTAAVFDFLRSTLVDESGGSWRLHNSDVAGMSIIGVGQQYCNGPLYNPAEIVTVLSKRDDMNSDFDRRTQNCEFRFIYGSTTEMSPGQSLTVTVIFAQEGNQTTSDAPAKVFQMATEIVVGVVTSGTKRSYTLYNLTFDRVSLPGRSS